MNECFYTCASSSLAILYQVIPKVPCLARNVFLLYINYLQSQVPLYKYVDDSTLIYMCNTNDVSVMQESTEFCFTPDDNVRNSISSVVINGNLVETVEYEKLRGVTLSYDLTWNRHVECIVKKAAKIVYKYVVSVKESRH